MTTTTAIPIAAVPGLQDDVARAEKLQAAMEAAAALPAPGPLLEAFVPSRGKFKFQPVVAIHWTILQRLGSPLLQMLAELSKPVSERKPLQPTDEDVFAMLLLFDVPPREAYAMVTQKGRDGFIQEAVERIGMVMRFDEVQERAIACMEHVAWSLAPAMSHTLPAAPGETASFTPQPTAVPTASAGG